MPKAACRLCTQQDMVMKKPSTLVLAQHTAVARAHLHCCDSRDLRLDHLQNCESVQAAVKVQIACQALFRMRLYTLSDGIQNCAHANGMVSEASKEER